MEMLMEPAFLLAIAHHMALIVLVGALAAETALLRPGLSAADVGRLGRLDAVYGLSALLLLGVGVARTVFGLKGWAFYADNPFFWTKIGLFLGVGLLSIPPTLRIADWRRQIGNVSTAGPDAADVARTRVWLFGQWALLAAIPAMAAALGQNL
jgi:putative membrane protein